MTSTDFLYATWVTGDREKASPSPILSPSSAASSSLHRLHAFSRATGSFSSTSRCKQDADEHKFNLSVGWMVWGLFQVNIEAGSEAGDFLFGSGCAVAQATATQV